MGQACKTSHDACIAAIVNLALRLTEVPAVACHRATPRAGEYRIDLEAT
jgi:hypothetical protein